MLTLVRNHNVTILEGKNLGVWKTHLQTLRKLRPVDCKIKANLDSRERERRKEIKKGRERGREEERGKQTLLLRGIITFSCHR